MISPELFERMAAERAALEWIFRDLGGLPEQPLQPVRVVLKGGPLDEQRTMLAQFSPELRHDHEEPHPLLDAVVVRSRAVYWPSFFVPLTYCYAGSVRL